MHLLSLDANSFQQKINKIKIIGLCEGQWNLSVTSCVSAYLCAVRENVIISMHRNNLCSCNVSVTKTSSNHPDSLGCTYINMHIRSRNVILTLNCNGYSKFSILTDTLTRSA